MHARHSTACAQIDHTTPGDNKTVTVSGASADLVQQAVQQIITLVADVGAPGQGDVSETVECPPGIVGRIIGRGGETIRGLQQASGAHIVVNQVNFRFDVLLCLCSLFQHAA